MQGKAKLSGTDTQKDAGTGKAVVCQYTVSFPDGSTPVAATVSILSDSEFANRSARFVHRCHAAPTDIDDLVERWCTPASTVGPPAPSAS